MSADFTAGQSSDFTSQSNVVYDTDGAHLTVAKSGDAPQLNSNWYIMFGHVEVVMKAAPGAGIVSSVVLQSDDLDEIDWEWLGATNAEVQSNYFGKGQTTTYNRAAVHAASGSQDSFHTYTIDWTHERIVWQINGVTVRVLEEGDAHGQFPQTPCQLKLGAWSGGDSGNAQGTIDWSQGPTDYTQGPFTMVVQSASVIDYSTGDTYSYGDRTGTWTSIVAVNGEINANAGAASGTDTTAPQTTSSSASGNPEPFEGTHRSQESAYTTPTVYPWVPLSTTFSSATVTNTNYPGLPSGWTVSSNGKVVPPQSAAPVSKDLPVCHTTIEHIN
jgi:beta-glucanase (GH16 family)